MHPLPFRVPRVKSDETKQNSPPGSGSSFQGSSKRTNSSLGANFLIAEIPEPTATPGKEDDVKNYSAIE